MMCTLGVCTYVRMYVRMQSYVHMYVHATTGSFYMRECARPYSVVYVIVSGCIATQYICIATLYVHLYAGWYHLSHLLQFLGPDAFSLADFRSLLEKRDHTRRQLLEESATKEAQIREMVAALGQENEGLKARVASLEGQVRKGDQAFVQNQQLASVVRAKDDEIRRLSEEVQRLRAEAAKRETERASLQAKVQKLMKQVSVLCCRAVYS